MTPAQKTNAALTDVCHVLLYRWELRPEQIANLAKDIPGECALMRLLDRVIEDDALTLSKESTHE